MSASSSARTVTASALAVRFFFRSWDNVTDASFVEIKFHPERGKTFQDAVARARQEVRARQDLLQVDVRRMDFPTHPEVCQWERDSIEEPWTFEWKQGADDPAADPIEL
jgi:hypothetical protein